MVSNELLLSMDYYEMVPVKCDFCDKIMHRMQKTIKSEMIRFPDRKHVCSRHCTKKLRFAPDITLKCDNCQKEFRLKNCDYAKRIRKNETSKMCCSRDCANKINIFRSEESRKKVSETLKQNHREKMKKLGYSADRRRPDKIANKKNQCVICKKEFLHYKRDKKLCSKECHHIFFVEVGKKAGRASAAVPRHKKNRSYNEKLFFSKIKEVYPEAEHTQRIFDGWDADIVIPSLKLAIHWNGPWHYRPILGQDLLDKVVWKDKMRYEAVIRFGYENYIIKDSGAKSDKKVNEEFLIFLQKYKCEPQSKT